MQTNIKGRAARCIPEKSRDSLPLPIPLPPLWWDCAQVLEWGGGNEDTMNTMDPGCTMNLDRLQLNSIWSTLTKQ